MKNGDSASSLINYLWNNSKASTDILNIKEIVWKKTPKKCGINNFNYITGLSNYKEIEKYSFKAEVYTFFYSQ